MPVSLPREAIIWIVALLLLACYQPVHQAHFSFCLFSHLGMEWCPGCGLGRSIAFLLKGQLIESLRIHPLGFVAVIILVRRIFMLCFQSIYHHNTIQNGKDFRNTP